MIVAVLVTVTIGLPYIFSRAASPFRRVQVFETRVPEQPVAGATRGQIKIATFNIAHGRGIVRSNWDGGTRAERQFRLDKIAQLLREVDADVVVLNEVDFDASWSYSVNQAAFLAEKAGYSHRVEQRNVDARLGLWTWKFGNAVLSRFPISEGQVIELPGYAWWETILGGKKCGVTCNLDTGAGDATVVAVHLSHRREAIRVASADAIVELARQNALPVIVAGDFNSTPPGFPHSEVADGRNAMQVFAASDLFRQQPEKAPAEAAGLTFHSQQPTMLIDWILTPRDWGVSDYRVVDTELSDHRLVVTTTTPVEP